MRSIFLYLIIILLLPMAVYAQKKRDCQVTFKISGERNDAKGNYVTEMNVTQRCYDFDKVGLQAQLKDDK